MAVADSTDLSAYCLDVARRAQVASQKLASCDSMAKERWLRLAATALRERSAEIIAAIQIDLDQAPRFGLSDAQIDRLKLTAARIESIAAGLDQVRALPDPIGEVIESSVRPNGLQVCKVRVPLGVIFFIYESRPNVTADAAALCVKSGNAVILRGGKEAAHSSRAIVDILIACLEEVGLPADAVQLVSTTDREAVGHFLRMNEYITVAIPRGGEGLIRRVAAEARMPVIKHFDGNCHVYVDRAADLTMAERVTVNAKCQRMGVCNAAESLLVHADIAAQFLPRIATVLRDRGVELRGDARVCDLAPSATLATEQDFATEFLGPVISVAVVDSLDAAIDHINRYGSKHTDAIITADADAARQFEQRVDSSAVMVNASTRFNDGFELGLGAEIGISTDKLHARGPCGLRELTSYKYVCHGTGQVRE
ncbi:MAG: glutamate-5-semialdehyde dehydrogenase [Pirellulales bacterium]|nr:glutamate-5-semialdehyde dehydrogenase [Pirellulales bacterium]